MWKGGGGSRRVQGEQRSGDGKRRVKGEGGVRLEEGSIGGRRCEIGGAVIGGRDRES